MKKRKSYERKIFHISYIFEFIFIMVMYPSIWLEVRLGPSKHKGFIEGLGAFLNHHTCEFDSTVVNDDGHPHRECKNSHCNIVTMEDTDGKWYK